MSENAFEASLESTEMDETKKQALVRNLCDSVEGWIADCNTTSGPSVVIKLKV